MHRKMFGSTKRRIVTILAAVLALIGGGFGVASLASASPAAVHAVAPCAGGTPGALICIPASAPRGEYVDANGIHHCLPTGNAVNRWDTGDYLNMAFVLADPGCDFGASARAVTAPAPVRSTPAVKRETNVTVNVDFDATKPISVTGLPAFRAGSPELWGDNTGSITDAASDIVVQRIGATELAPNGTCPTVRTTGEPSSAGFPRAVGSTVQKFCIYPKHYSAIGSAPVSGFLAGQSYALNVWVYAP